MIGVRIPSFHDGTRFDESQQRSFHPLRTDPCFARARFDFRPSPDEIPLISGIADLDEVVRRQIEGGILDVDSPDLHREDLRAGGQWKARRARDHCVQWISKGKLQKEDKMQNKTTWRVNQNVIGRGLVRLIQGKELTKEQQRTFRTLAASIRRQLKREKP